MAVVYDGVQNIRRIPTRALGNYPPELRDSIIMTQGNLLGVQTVSIDGRPCSAEVYDFDGRRYASTDGITVEPLTPSR